MRLLRTMELPSRYGCYIIFEVWDGTPPVHQRVRPTSAKPPSRPASASASASARADARILRVLYNARPTRLDVNLVPQTDFVDESDEIVLAQVPIAHASRLLSDLIADVETRGIQLPAPSENGAGGSGDDED
jgi:hypothetical protein